MRGYKASTFQLSDQTKKILQKFSASCSLPASLVLRSKIILLASEGWSNPQIIAATGAAYTTVSKWRNCFYNSRELIAHTEESLDSDGNNQKLERAVKSVLSDKQRPGKKPVFTPEQILLINKLACKNPKDFGWELSHWNLPLLQKQSTRESQGLFHQPVYSVFPILQVSLHGKTAIGLILRKNMRIRTALKKIEIICSLYLESCKLSEDGTEVYSTDKMTGIQALERKYPDRPVCPGRPPCMDLNMSVMAP